VSVVIKVLLLVVLVVCGALPMVIMVKAEGAVWRIQRASWAGMSHNQRVVQGVLVPAWFGVVAVAFVVGYLVSGHAATAAAAAGITALVMIVLGPFVGFAVARSVSKHRSRDAVTGDPSLK
jgi:hypothetical protein